MVKCDVVLFSTLLRRASGEGIGQGVDLAGPRATAMPDWSPVNRFTLIARVVASSFWTLPPEAERFVTANAFFEHLGLVRGFVFAAPADLRRAR
jgi:hypothetical protein